MPAFKYLIIGGGMTADAAVRGIRELDSNGTIGVLGNEPDPPYDRPPLTKSLWKGKPLEKIWRKTEACIESGDVFSHEYRITRPDGAVRWIFNQSHVGLDANGAVVDRYAGRYRAGQLSRRRCGPAHPRNGLGGWHG